MTNFSLTRPIFNLGLIVALGSLASACSLSDNQKVSFQYGGWTCLLGCEIDRPMLAGTRETILVDGYGADDDGVTVRSTNTAVATVAVARRCSCEHQDASGASATSLDPGGVCPSGYSKQCDNDIEVAAVAPGDADVVLHRNDGTEIDRAKVYVARAATVRLVDVDQRQPLPNPVRIRVGDFLSIIAEFRDQSGVRLLASEGVTWSSTSVLEPDPFCFRCNSDTQGFHASAPGTGTVTVSAPNVSAVATFEVDP